MDLIPHWGDCKNQIEKLREELAEAQAQSITYMRDLTEVTCKLRMEKLKKSDCSDCKKQPEVTIIEM